MTLWQASRRVEKTLRSLLPSDRPRILVALSGGADSVYLLHALVEYSKENGTKGTAFIYKRANVEDTEYTREELVEDFNEEEALKEAADKAAKTLRDLYIREALVKAEDVKLMKTSISEDIEIIVNIICCK